MTKVLMSPGVAVPDPPGLPGSPALQHSGPRAPAQVLAGAHHGLPVWIVLGPAQPLAQLYPHQARLHVLVCRPHGVQRQPRHLWKGTVTKVLRIKLCKYPIQILAPLFQVSRSWLGDVLQSRLLDEMTETLQDCINHFSERLPKLTKPPPNTFFGPVRKPRLFKHYLSLNQENITAVLLFLQ